MDQIDDIMKVVRDAIAKSTEGGMKKLGDTICIALGVERSRLSKCDIVDTSIPGKTGVQVEFDPKLSEEEEERLRGWITVMSEFLGGQKPIFMDPKELLKHLK